MRARIPPATKNLDSQKISPRSTPNPTQRDRVPRMLDWKNRKVQFAWLCVAAWSLVIVGLLGSDSFSSDFTGSVIKAVIRFFVPDINPRVLLSLHRRIRKAAHMVEYGILALLCVRALWISMSSERRYLRIAILALLYALFVATLDEARQAFSAHRTGSPFDTLIDFSGASLALLFWWLFLRWRSKQKMQQRSSSPSESAPTPS